MADSPERVAAGVERTICIVETTAQAESVIAGEHGIMRSAKPGHIVICMSTIDPFAAKRLAESSPRAACTMLDAPVSGGTERAKSGELSIIAGGEAATFDACHDLFKAMGTNLFHVGPLGSGLAMKLVNNMLIQVNRVAVAEAMVLGVKAGLDPQKIYDVVRVSTGTSYAFEHGVPKILGATSPRAARWTSPTRIRSSRRRSPSSSACRCCWPTSPSSSTRWRARPASTRRTAWRSSRSSRSSPACRSEAAMNDNAYRTRAERGEIQLGT